jgi:hypothetical protein
MARGAVLPRVAGTLRLQRSGATEAADQIGPHRARHLLLPEPSLPDESLSDSAVVTLTMMPTSPLMSLTRSPRRAPLPSRSNGIDAYPYRHPRESGDDERRNGAI